MSNHRQNKKDRCIQLMMAEIDGELSSAQKHELYQLINNFPELSPEQQSFHRIKEVTDQMKLKEPKSEIWETYWFNVYNRIERGLAWFVFTLGAAILIVYGLIKAVSDLWQDPTIAPILKVGIFGALLGVVLLLISIVREKLFLRNHERYKEVQR